LTRHVCIPSNYSNKIGIQILKIGVSRVVDKILFELGNNPLLL